jgi:hypothetical protein
MTNTVPFEALKKGMWITAYESLDGSIEGGWTGKIVNIADTQVTLIDHLDDQEYLEDHEQMSYVVLQDAPQPDYVVRREDINRLGQAQDKALQPSLSDAPRSSVETAWLDEFRAAVKTLLENAVVQDD